MAGLLQCGDDVVLVLGEHSGVEVAVLGVLQGQALGLAHAFAQPQYGADGARGFQRIAGGHAHAHAQLRELRDQVGSIGSRRVGEANHAQQLQGIGRACGYRQHARTGFCQLALGFIQCRLLFRVQLAQRADHVGRTFDRVPLAPIHGVHALAAAGGRIE
ncbi:hypothetical protein GALL_514750 [mine drainage metagenome]|uniref:Uncharacterized protein n=1 Tax=mine drainage metagenome TaxID=410659 RepID=A0A1J5PGM3_9ZZZZ